MSMNNSERVELTRGRHPFYVHVGDVRPPRPFQQAGGESLQPTALAFGDDFDAPVGEITRPADEGQIMGRFKDEKPVAYALDATGDVRVKPGRL